MPLSLGLALFAFGAFLSSRLTPSWQADDFRLTMIVIGLGQGLFLVPTVYYATRDVSYDDAAPLGRRHFFVTASSLGNVLFLMIILLSGIAAVEHVPCRQS